MTGGKVLRLWELDDGAWVEKIMTGYTLADINASEITYGEMPGTLIVDRSIPIDKMQGSPITAGETLTAGQLVHVMNDNGSFRLMRADADNAREAHGFVLENTAIGGIAYMYSSGYNPFMSGLMPGTQFLSTTPGAVTSTPPSAQGTMVQRVGVAIGATVLNFMQNSPIHITS